LSWVKEGLNGLRVSNFEPDGIIGMIDGSVRTIFFDTGEKTGTGFQWMLNWEAAKKIDGSKLAGIAPNFYS
jgi:hypothetical protein